MKTLIFFISLCFSISMQAAQISYSVHVNLDACDLDLDGNGQTDALTDGILLARYLFGFTGSTLTDGALGTGATRTANDIVQILDAEACQQLVDLDGNGQIDALTDGIILVRFLFGYTGTDMTSGAVAPDAKLKTSESIITLLAFYRSPRESVVGVTDLQPGDATSDPFQDFIIRNTGNTNASVDITKGVNENGATFYRMTGSGSVSIQLPDINLLTQNDITRTRTTRSSSNSCQNITDVGWPDGGWCKWSTSYDRFVRNGDIEGRLPHGTEVIDGVAQVDGNWWDFNVFTKESSQLISMCDKSDRNCYDLKTPVLFIHGFTVRGLVGPSLGGLGGGYDTWADFPKILADDYDLNQSGIGLNITTEDLVPFEFKWRTNARLQDVARDLYAEIKNIAVATGKKVHIIAASYGGVLIRTLLQKIGDPDDLFSSGADSDQQIPTFTKLEQYIATVTTVGSPHSGIADTNRKNMHGVYFPEGQDGGDYTSFEGCDQISCQQMGEAVTSINEEVRLYKIKQEPGWLAARLANTKERLPDIDLQILIGMTSQRGINNKKMDDGDNLITFHGQRFLPQSTSYDSDIIAPEVTSSLNLFKNANFGSGTVTEKLLGFNSDEGEKTLKPGDDNPRYTGGGCTDIYCTKDIDDKGERFIGYIHSEGTDQILGVGDREPRESYIEDCDFTGLIVNEIGNCSIENISSYQKPLLRPRRLHGTLEALKDWFGDHQSTTIVAPEEMQVTVRVVADNGTPIQGALVKLIDASTGATIYETTTTSENTNLTFNFDTNRTYKVYASLTNYRTAPTEFQTYNLVSETNTDLGSLTLYTDDVPVSPEIKVTFKSALTGNLLEGVSYSVRRIDSSIPFITGETGADGIFITTDLVAGSYLLDATINGYEAVDDYPLFRTAGEPYAIAMSPILVGDGTTRIVLTWDVNPRDLDSHLIKYDNTGTELYHIYFYDRSDVTTQDNLDLDDISSYGPETVTIQDLDPTARYVYAVHHYNGIGSISSTSDARVSIVLGDGTQRVYNAPITGDGVYWKVFEINNGVIEPCSGPTCIMDSGATSYTRSRRSDTEIEWLEIIKTNLKAK